MAIFPGKTDAPTEQAAGQHTLDLLLDAATRLADGKWNEPLVRSDDNLPTQVHLILEQLERLRQDHAGRLQRIRNAGTSVQRSSIELGQTSQDLYQEIATFSAALKTLSEGATQQSQMANTLDVGMGSISEEAAQHQTLAQDAEATSTQIHTQIAQGEKHIDEVLRGWEVAIDQLRDAGGEIEAFETTARDISSIVEVISEISHRTNVLSLNASLEADRSGEEGEAFSVLATEIRGLSENAKRQAHDIDGLIQGFLQRQSSLLHRLREGIADLDQGAQAVGVVRTNLQDTVSGIESVAMHIERLAKGFAQLAERISFLREQAREVSNISEKHADVTQRTVAQTRDRMLVGADQLLHEARNLDRVSQELSKSVQNSDKQQAGS